MHPTPKHEGAKSGWQRKFANALTQMWQSRQLPESSHFTGIRGTAQFSHYAAMSGALLLYGSGVHDTSSPTLRVSRGLDGFD